MVLDSNSVYACGCNEYGETEDANKEVKVTSIVKVITANDGLDVIDVCGIGYNTIIIKGIKWEFVIYFLLIGSEGYKHQSLRNDISALFGMKIV